MKDRLDILQEMRRSVRDDFCLYWAITAAIDAYIGNEEGIAQSIKLCQKFKKDLEK